MARKVMFLGFDSLGGHSTTRERKMDFDNCEDDQCSAHVRTDTHTLDRDSGFVFMVTYSDDYVVCTIVAPELVDPIMAIARAVHAVVLPAYVTCIWHVGEGVLASIGGWDGKGKSDLRFIERHDNFSRAENAHEMVLAGLTSRLIDVSSPVSPEELRLPLSPVGVLDDMEDMEDPEGHVL